MVSRMGVARGPPWTLGPRSEQLQQIADTTAFGAAHARLKRDEDCKPVPDDVRTRAGTSPASPQPDSTTTDIGVTTPIYRITVVARTTKAINYHHRSGSARISFRGRALMPEARGEATVESKQGVIKIDAGSAEYFG